MVLGHLGYLATESLARGARHFAERGVRACGQHYAPYIYLLVFKHNIPIA
jgi:hypothetical protein